MYINFRIFIDSGLTSYDFINLIAVKQVQTDIVQGFTLAEYNRLQELSLVRHIKAKNKQEHPYNSLRLSDKGKKLLEEIGEAEVEEEDKKVFEFLKAHYLKLDKEIGNGKKTMRHVRDFRLKSGIEKNNLIRLCLAFLQDADNMIYNCKLEYAFYKPATAFETRFNLEDSRLYKYYLKRESYFKSIFEEY